MNKVLKYSTYVVLSIFALYGLIILIQKIRYDGKADRIAKGAGMKYWVEPYRPQCSCGLFSCDKGCNTNYCGISAKSIMKAQITEKDKETLKYCPDYLEDCRDYFLKNGKTVPTNLPQACTMRSVTDAIFDKQYKF